MESTQNLKDRLRAERRVPLRGDAEDVLCQMHEQGISGAVFTDRNENGIRPDRAKRRFKAMEETFGD